ncbi:MAG TPA: hypothetical protein VG165_05305 [Solirubrobacteraceae bacterium]|nr:hypothetical protein [Solirubrobacteraceae bacterium]
MTSREIVAGAAVAVAVANGLVGAYGWFRWYLVQESRGFWIGVRVGQLASLGYAVLVGGLWVAGRRPDDSLFYIYALLPLAIGMIAEQLRLAAAEQVLLTRGLENAQAVGELPQDEQRSVVVAILRREMGVMAAAALVVSFLLLRAWGTAHGF